MYRLYKVPCACVIIMIMLCLTTMQAAVVDTRDGQSIGLIHQKQSIATPNYVQIDVPIYAPLQESLVDHFERANIAPWTTEGGYDWAIRDTADTYGPNTPAIFGYQYPGIPGTDVPTYTGNQNGRLVSPAIDITGWGTLYLSFNYWGDFEGTATWFDGGLIEISSDNGSTWKQVDSLAQGHLDPTYDHTLAGGSALGTKWGYCYDTGNPPGWINVVSVDLVGLGYVTPTTQLKVRFNFASDQLEGGQGWFIDDVRIGSDPPPDLQPPVIDHTPLADTTDTLNNYTISATIIDEGSGVDSDSVTLFYQIESGSEVAVDMINTVGDVYEADIPMQTYHTDIYYRIEAADLASTPNLAITAQYTFEVTNARTIIYDEGNPYWITGDLAPGTGLFNHFTFSDVGIDSGLLHKVMLYFDGPGPFDLRVYKWASFQPGTFIDSLANLESAGYDWSVIEVTDLNIQVADAIVVGFMCGTNGPDTTRVLMDPTQEYPQIMWGLTGGTWTQTPYTGGELMIRIKVIPLYPSGIDDNTTSATKAIFALARVAPNPTRNSNISIQYQISETQPITLSIYDVTGKLVKTLVNAETNAGTHTIVWNPGDEQGRLIANGVYLLRLQGKNEHLVQKLIITQ